MPMELWPGGPVMESAPGVQPVGTDSVVLSDFVNLSGIRRGADLGCGSGLIAILLAQRSPALRLDLVDISPSAAELAGKNVAANSLQDRLRVMCRDLRGLRESEVGKYQLIVSNPPYFPQGSGTAPASPDRAAARVDGECTLEELSETSARLLGDGGRFAMCVPSGRLSQALSTLSRAGLEPKRLRLMQARIDSPPSLALIECRRGGRPGLRVEPVLIIKDSSGADTPEIRRIYHLE